MSATQLFEGPTACSVPARQHEALQWHSSRQNRQTCQVLFRPVRDSSTIGPQGEEAPSRNLCRASGLDAIQALHSRKRCAAIKAEVTMPVGCACQRRKGGQLVDRARDKEDEANLADRALSGQASSLRRTNAVFLAAGRAASTVYAGSSLALRPKSRADQWSHCAGWRQATTIISRMWELISLPDCVLCHGALL